MKRPITIHLNGGSVRSDRNLANLSTEFSWVVSADSRPGWCKVFFTNDEQKAAVAAQKFIDCATVDGPARITSISFAGITSQEQVVSIIKKCYDL